MKPWRFFWLSCRLATGVMVLAFILPMLAILIQSFSTSLTIVPKGFTMRWYTLKFEDIIASLGATFLIGILASLLSLLYTLPAVYAITKRNFRGRRALDQIIILPNMIPGIVFGVALLQFFKGVGLGDLPPFIILIIIHSVIVIPFIALPLMASFEQIDVSLEEAAMTLGSNELLTFKDIVFPLLVPGILSGLFLAFARSSGEFIITLFFVTPDFIPLSVRVFQSTSYGIPQVTSAIAVTLMIVSTAYILISRKLLKVDFQ